LIRDLRALAALVGCCLALACGPGPDEPARPGDVLLVTVDTLRADRVGLLGQERDLTPNIDRFFAQGAVYERAYATAAATSPSVVSLLTGLAPVEHGVRLLYQLVPKEVALVTERLPESWQTAAFVSSAVVTDEALGIADRFDHYDDFVDEQELHRVNYERRAERTTDALLEWVRTEADPDRPLFLWVHYIDPHGPYHAPEPFNGTQGHEGHVPVEARRIPRYQLAPGVDDALDYVDRYDEEVAYLDAQFARLVKGLGAERSLDEALVFLTADHGETLIGHERWFAHDWHVYEELIRVPLLVRGPGTQPGRSSAPISNADVVPTILRHVGVAPGSPLSDVDPSGIDPSGIDLSGIDLSGIDLRQPGLAPRDRVVLAESTKSSGQWLAAIAAEEKALVSVGAGRRVGERRAYPIGDPETARESPPAEGELVDLLLRFAEDDPAPAGIPAEVRRGMKPGAPKVAPGISPEAEERLRALGYVE